MKPIEGMTTEPCGMPLMFDAWFGLLLFVAANEDAMKQFKADTGMTLDPLFSKGLNAAIDEATGFRKASVVAFADWVTTNYWGVEGQELEAAEESESRETVRKETVLGQ